MDPADLGSENPELSRALAAARSHLLASRTNGHWRGRLSSSALSTATSVFALHCYSSALGARANRLEPLISGGLRWLLDHQNTDGGWGDTILSHSNISTTALCWAALSVGGSEVEAAVHRAERWLAGQAGSLDASSLAEAIASRYGKDRTFSVPILTMCALAGRLGTGSDAWRLVPPLPFELAAFPRAWFSRLKLPVVSYALPALIAIGQVGHEKRKPSGRIVWKLRERLRSPTLSVLREIQPRGGGFLEAAPLTGFVAMSLASSGSAELPVCTEAVDFLERSVQADGSWPIDTDLATWLTTLSINALGELDAGRLLDADERSTLLEWLLNQQYESIHPYTMARPGGWAWTDLPGGVPDADDTAGALLALRNLWNVATSQQQSRILPAATAGALWLLDLQNRDGGMPTFCKGWGALPFDRSGTDLTAHALHAWSRWKPLLPASLRRRIEIASKHGLAYLAHEQRSDGSWAPLWFGNQDARDEENPTYGTARVLTALTELEGSADTARQLLASGLHWLTSAQRADGGWGGDASAPASIEETSLAVVALSPHAATNLAIRGAVERGVQWLLWATEGGNRFEPTPIGFYFARLWYYEAGYPLLFGTAAFTAAMRALEES